MNNLTKQLKPVLATKYVGIEFEFISSKTRAKLVESINKLGLSKYCNLGEDSSIETENDGGIYNDDLDDLAVMLQDLCDELSNADEDTKRSAMSIIKDIKSVNLDKILSDVEKSLDDIEEGFELRVLVKEGELKQVLAKLQVFFKLNKCSVNDSCGLHVHLDMRNRDVDVCFNRLVSKQDDLYDMCDGSRQDNSYCRRVESYQTANMTGHYNGINAGSAYNQHRTIEVRIKEGTTDCKDVHNWITTLIDIVENKNVKSKKRTA